MFSGIKEKILNVKKNVNLFSSEEKSPKPIEKQDVNYQAGAPILHHYEKQWETIHDNNENNAKLAETVANQIERVSRKIETDKKNMDAIKDIVTNSKFCTNVTKCLNQVQTLYESCERIENDLIELENVIEEIEFKQMQNRHVFHLKQYEIRRQETFEALKASKEENYQKKLKEQEENLKKTLEERQKVFQEAFKNDIEIYKNLGTIPKVELKQRQSSALLEEIQLDYDQNELDNFFKD